MAYGYITNKSVVELVHRRAFVESKEGKKVLSDNLTVERALGEHNMICLNDLSHEIYHVGSNFDIARKFLCTFKLSSPVGHYEKKVLKVNDDVESGGGFLGEDMDAFLNKIL